MNAPIDTSATSAAGENVESFERALKRLDGLPTGDAEAWKRRYAPLVDEIVVHQRPPAPELSVIVVAWRAAEFIEDCLAYIDARRGETPSMELILVDNGGMEPAREVIAQYADLEIRMKDNARLCRARNTAVAHARGDLVAFIDDDGLVTPGYFENALRYFKSDVVAGIRSRIVAREHPYFTTLASHYDRGDSALEDCLVTEGSSVLRRDWYIRAGGFAESLAGHEGIDLTFRIKQLDPEYRIVYAPDVVMAHDYFDGWGHFLRKSLNYSNIDELVLGERPELAAFLKDYFTWSFPPPSRSTREALARTGLQWVRSALQTAAKYGFDLPLANR